MQNFKNRTSLLRGMESLPFELNRAVKIAATYSNLLTRGNFNHGGLSIHLEGQGNFEVHSNHKLFAKGKSSDPKRITDSIDWVILNTDDSIVSQFYSKVNKMTIKVIKDYSDSNALYC